MTKKEIIKRIKKFERETKSFADALYNADDDNGNYRIVSMKLYSLNKSLIAWLEDEIGGKKHDKIIH